MSVPETTKPAEELAVDPRGDDDPIDELRVLDEETWQEIHAYCAERFEVHRSEGSIEQDVREIEVMDGVWLVLDIDHQFVIHDILIDPERVTDEYRAPPPERTAPVAYLSNIAPVFDRLRQEIADAMNYDPVFAPEYVEDDRHRWHGYV